MLYLLAEVDPLGHVLDKTLRTHDGTPQGVSILTLHMVTAVVAGLICIWLMMVAAKAIDTGPATKGNERYITKGRFAQMIEVMVVYLRDTVILPILGAANTAKYLPFLLTVFFFLLANNVLGLLPLLDLQHILGSFFISDPNHKYHWAVIGGTATGNLAMTGAMALVAFIVIQVHGFRDMGVAGWAKHLTGGAPLFLLPIMLPIELMGMIIKPAALAIRLFANMLAGHTLLATLMLFGSMAYAGLGALGAGGVTLVAVPFAVGIFFLEIFVAFLQAFIFMFLVTLFIGQMSHHEDHGHDHGHEHEHGGGHGHGHEAAGHGAAHA